MSLDGGIFLSEEEQLLRETGIHEIFLWSDRPAGIRALFSSDIFPGRSCGISDVPCSKDFPAVPHQCIL